MPSHQKLESEDLVRPSPFYSCCGRCSIGHRRKRRYVALIPLSRYKDTEEMKEFDMLSKRFIFQDRVTSGEPVSRYLAIKQKQSMPKTLMPATIVMNLSPEQLAVIDKIVESSSVFQSREHFIQVAIDWTLKSDLGEVVAKLLKH